MSAVPAIVPILLHQVKIEAANLLVRHPGKSSVAPVAGHVGRLALVSVRSDLLETGVHIVVVQDYQLQRGRIITLGGTQRSGSDVRKHCKQQFQAHQEGHSLHRHP